jgi:hypothetical protein
VLTIHHGAITQVVRIGTGESQKGHFDLFSQQTISIQVAIPHRNKRTGIQFKPCAVS